MDGVSLYAVGDVAITRNDPASAFAHSASVLKEPDILFGQLEVNLSQKGTPSPAAPSAQKPPTNLAPVLRSAGFDIMSFANNHHLDMGAVNFLDTLTIARQNDIRLVGVGKDISEARQPVIMQEKGLKIAFLAYSSILPVGYWATEERPGCAPIRVQTLYEKADAYFPGSPAETYTYAYKPDLQAMVEDIEKVRPVADIVVMSIHWGLHFMPALLTMDQREVGHVAIDAGVDLVLGHHAHILKGIEVYKGKVIFYSLGNFIMDSIVTRTWPHVPADWRKREKLYNFKIDPEWGGTYPFPPDSRKTMLAKHIISSGKIERVSFRPFLVNRLNQPEALSRHDDKFEEVVKYMEWTSADQGLDTRFSIDGDEVLIHT